MVDASKVVIIDLSDAGNRLRVSASARESIPGSEPTFAVTYEAVGHPFAGTIEETVFASDLRRTADSLRALDPTGRVTLGGERGVELVLTVEPQQGGQQDALVVEASITPSGDDPFPHLSWLLFGQARFGRQAADALDGLLGRSA